MLPRPLFFYDVLKANFQHFIQMVMEMMGEIPQGNPNSGGFAIDAIEFNAAIDMGGN